MGRIEKTFLDLAELKQKALIGYIVSGDPNMSSTLMAMHLMVEEGVHVIELGIAFSDPMAEGPSIQQGHERALAEKISLKATLKLVKSFREKDKKTPVVLMGYMNTFEALGSEVFSYAAKDNGVDGILIVDMPLEASDEFTEECRKQGLDVIRLIAPTTTESRIKKICKQASGYIYYISLKGITGADSINPEEVEKKVLKLKKLTDLPVVIGFGITLKTISSLKKADGLVVGSALCKKISESIKNRQNPVTNVSNMVRKLKDQIT